MLDATEVPFDASQFAFRTNFDGLSTGNPALTHHLENAKKSYRDSLLTFESQDKDAREEYKAAKDDGLTNAPFGRWAPENYPSWSHAKQSLQAAGGQLTQIAMQAFGPAYQQKIGQEQSNFDQAAYEAGHYPEFF
ncbi:hypothetical protein AO1008_04161 [Aspergillus oryzae 100-8]|uniref:Uncharacterized protein n=1 Tax=Aspergillus oryzae (strain 3.042) TaxID=1160506 RepID=I8IVU9_ASPO3|nr:hypothetical protein Ao3042_05160 [Aspergillus oryzae 3.042]KDE78109.1 hypothetical protein AO1008_04161 [Aspergillus oryzae 100-8]|eukprot:EIT83596.1 hypothetical protein Ao3042_05160 [Aspergillus oryzae 3.042]